MEDLQAHPWLSGNIFQAKTRIIEIIEEVKEETKAEEKQSIKKPKLAVLKPSNRNITRKV